MAVQRQHVPAGEDFGDANNPGLISFGSGSDVVVKRVSLIMGSETKDVIVTLVDQHGAEFGKIYEKLSMTNQNVDLIGCIPLAPGEQIKVVTASATAEMFVTAIY